MSLVWNISANANTAEQISKYKRNLVATMDPMVHVVEQSDDVEALCTEYDIPYICGYTDHIQSRFNGVTNDYDTVDQMMKILNKRNATTIQVDVYYKSTCSECDGIGEAIKEMRGRYYRSIDIKGYDFADNQEHVRSLLTKITADEAKRNEKIYVLSPAGHHLGLSAYQNMNKICAEAAKMSSDMEHENTSSETEEKTLTDREVMATVAWAPFFISALVDSINPCAFSLAVFLLMGLKFRRQTARKRAFCSFVCGVYCAYFLIGLLCYQLFASMAQYKTPINMVGAIICFGCALFYLLGKQEKIQLPEKLKRINKTLIGKAIGSSALTVAFVSGALVALCEGACTGQVYLPSVMLIARNGNLVAVSALALYNLLFVLPLIVIGFGYFRSQNSDGLRALLRLDAKWSRAFMPIFFLVMGCFLTWQI